MVRKPNLVVRGWMSESEKMGVIAGAAKRQKGKKGQQFREWRGIY